MAPLARKPAAAPRINRAPSHTLARSVPWLTIMLASVVPGWLMIASAPVLPPVGPYATVTPTAD